MKLIPTIAAMAFAFLVSLPTEVHAQETLKILIQKCETMDDVDINIIRRKDKKTGELEHSAVTITIKDNKPLCEEFEKAFRKDSESAEQEIISRKGKIVSSIFCRFGDVSYSYSQSSAGNATVSVIHKSTRMFNFDWEGRNFSIDNFSFDYSAYEDNIRDALEQAKKALTRRDSSKVYRID
ncbi:MAG: DUF5024 domain-containing protein [Mediterranea sp.]|jgi:hypothetical protein|nr:DUF5024 domain-containing protein [Mediterranea sp.]